VAAVDALGQTWPFVLGSEDVALRSTGSGPPLHRIFGSGARRLGAGFRRTQPTALALRSPQIDRLSRLTIAHAQIMRP
jgi:hypothetical protein